MTTELEVEQVVRHVTESLLKKFPTQDRADIERQVRAKVTHLKDRPIKDYVGVLAERAVKHRIKSP